MARKQWSDVGGVAHAIIKGEHDADLSYIQAACTQRLKQMYRKGTRVKLVGTRNPHIDGMEGVILKANTKSLTVRLDNGQEYNVIPGLLELIAPGSGHLTQVSIPA